MPIASRRAFSGLEAGFLATDLSASARGATPPRLALETRYRTIDVGGLEIFYRESGPAGAPVVLLHGFPTSSRMFRNLIPRLADKYRVIAPD